MSIESTIQKMALAAKNASMQIAKCASSQKNEALLTIATQNPTAHVGVSALGEALKDRFVWIDIHYQHEDEEIQIVELNIDATQKHTQLYATIAVRIINASRQHPNIRRGSSIRERCRALSQYSRIGSDSRRDLRSQATRRVG